MQVVTKASTSLRATRCAAPQLPARRVRVAYRVGQDTPEASSDVLETRRSNVATGIVFSPAQEVGQTLRPVEAAPLGPSHVPQQSLARMDFAQIAEVGINEQITTELTLSHWYLGAASYFGRDNVGLPGFAAHFKNSSDEERQHALRLMEFQLRRGGRVVLGSILLPQTEFEHTGKGDALHASEVALGLEKLNFAKLRELHTLAEEADDANMQHFIEDFLLDEQSRDVREAAVLVSQLHRAGKGLGVLTVDLQLQRKYGVGDAGGMVNGAGGGDGNGNGAAAVVDGLPLFVSPLVG